MEICFNETWGAICDDGWDDLDANVVCSSLGYSRFSKLSFISIIHIKTQIIGNLYLYLCSVAKILIVHNYEVPIVYEFKL